MVICAVVRPAASGIIARRMADLEAEIEDAAERPKRAVGDHGTYDQHPLPDLIAADRYLRGRAQQTAGKLGAKYRQIRPPGAS